MPVTFIHPGGRAETHAVTNQPPPFQDIDLFGTDRALVAAVSRAGGGQHAAHLEDFGRRVGSAEAIEWGVQANDNGPVLESFDRYGHRIDEVRFHPAYHRLMELGLEHGIAAAPWRGTPAGTVLHAAQSYLLGQVDTGPLCPMTMTYASVGALSNEPELARQWLPGILAARYDPACRPAAEKRGLTLGMALTEKQGGSDVRANTTRANAVDAARDLFLLNGHKWFCSAPMSDGFLTLAQTERGLTCFLLPRWLPDGSRNTGFRLMRLKAKLGDRSNASAEVEYDGALAWRVGEEGRGVSSIVPMIQHTRLDCAVLSAGNMRAALAQALWHTAHRAAFGRKLSEHPAMIAVLADLAVESEAATALAMRLAQAFDRHEPLARLLTPIAKYWICKRAPGFVYEAMECTGGNGYVEWGPMPRLFRQSPLNAIWEGSGNVIALDVLRAIAREPESLQALRELFAAATGRDPRFDAFLAALDFSLPPESQARRFVEQLALASQGAVLLQWDSALANAFCQLRLQHTALLYGAWEAQIDAAAIVRRAMPLPE